MNKHEHDKCCEHELAYCKVCDVVYCKKCGREWGKKEYVYYPYCRWDYEPRIMWTNTGGSIPKITYYSSADEATICCHAQ